MIETKRNSHVTTLVITRPEKRNALNWATIGQLARGIDEAEADGNCRCLVITGHGDNFVAGRDLDEAKSDGSLDDVLANDEAYTGIFTSLRNMSKPSISVVRGYAVAGGFTLAMGCDFVLADKTAKFGALEMRGGFPAAVNTAILNHLVGPRAALELLLSADIFDADHLHRVGLINHLYETSEELSAGADKMIQGLVHLEPTAVKLTKETHRATVGMPISEALTVSKHLNALMMSSGRINEAAAIFENYKKQNS